MPVVHVIDDDDAVRESLALLMEAAGLTAHAYACAEDFLDAVERAAPGCVITDVRMPDMSGIDLLHRLSDRLDQFPVIVLTGEADVPMAVEALKGGALDLIEKPYAAGAILAAVTGALRQLETRRERTSRRAESSQRLAALSAREREVLQGLLAGNSNKEIARDLAISPRTVEAYRANLMMKMGAESLSELVRMSLDAEGSE
ncbi:response regulator FixJ [Phenylobacterium sp.]|uniref:response regulator FixJ n=1 Tax=Phenylobacterium sp. TaxID=1871053 RepID=UPI002ED95C83